MSKLNQLVEEIKGLKGENVKLIDVDNMAVDNLSQADSIFEYGLEEMLIDNESFSYYIDRDTESFMNVEMKYISGDLKAQGSQIEHIIVKITDVWVQE